MSNPPVCHISTGSIPAKQPRATLLPTVQTPVDLPSAIAAINQLKLLIQMMAGQQSVSGARGNTQPVVGSGGGAGLLGGGGFNTVGSPGKEGQKGKDAKDDTGGRFIEDRSKRVTQKKRIFQNNDKTSENWVDIQQINRCVWVDKVTGETIVWSR